MSIINWFYTEGRAHRSEWICERFRNELTECNSILDIGCSESALKNFLPSGCAYTGVDIVGNPDFKIDLDKIDVLPFGDAQFDGVVCADVIEHLENLHHIFDELCRVTRRYLIITLPNPAYGLYRYILNKEYDNLENRTYEGKYIKFYGLPPEKPIDRHRWFFGYNEAVDFIKYRSKKNKLYLDCIENNLLYEKQSLHRRIVLWVLKHLNENLAYRNIVFLLSKKSV